ncbi:outer membrane protein assembly factor BamB family protein [Halobaculum roseum]|uniref:PQQ-binding-like beta-propeller repeat protein n=1 Tax=Halobaculum roseum TaxID=2175149 RepID=A0ABD5MLI9_9EURY|nr:PQQ-binding-like beta-propeller repeat protein [Halobaculum roseum]QZY03290.1 PQQ-binding-like beta-propeller repeat protein [Halobaculum roseum]
MSESSEWLMHGPDAAQTSAVNGTGPTETVVVSPLVETEQSLTGGPVHIDDTLYIGENGYPDDDTHVYAIDTADGSVRWNAAVDSVDAQSLAITGDTLIVVESRTPFDGETAGAITALNRHTGAVRWRTETDDCVLAAPTVVDGTVYVGCTDQTLYALSVASGEIEWTYETLGDIFSPPAVVDGTVYVGGGEYIYAIDADDGTRRWWFETDDHDLFDAPPGGGTRNAIAVENGTAYVGSGDGLLYALDATTGAVEWRFRPTAVNTTSGAPSITSSPAVADGAVYFATAGDEVYSVSAADGVEQWSVSVPRSGDARPIVTDEMLYLGAGVLRGFDRETGAERWKATAIRGGQYPILVDETLYVPGNDGTLYTVR